MHFDIHTSHDALWQTFYCPQTQLIYEYPFSDPSQFPSPDEIARSIPSCAGWVTGMEDCALIGGFVLDGMLAAHRVSGDAIWATKARLLFQGLVRLGTISNTRGFVARGFAPGRSDFYPNSSADQYTSFVYAMWRFARSEIATKDERRIATEILVDIAKLVENFADDIPRVDGKPSIYGDTSVKSADRACRLLQFYLAAHDLSGDHHWREIYLRKAHEDGGIRLRSHYGPQPFDAKRNIHCVAQSQLAHRLLYECETEPDIRAAHKQAMRAQALAVMDRLPRWHAIANRGVSKHDYPPRWRTYFAAFLKQLDHVYQPSVQSDVKLWHHFLIDHAHDFPPTDAEKRHERMVYHSLRHPVEALGTVMLSEEPDLKKQAATEGWTMLNHVDWSRVNRSDDWECLDLAYWRGVECGVFPAPVVAQLS